MDEADGHAVVGVGATAVLVKGATEGRPELHEHEQQVILAASVVPGPGARAIFHLDIVGPKVDTGRIMQNSL